MDEEWINYISSLLLVLMFIGDILEMDRDEALTHFLSQICIRTSNETRTSNATHTSSETLLNVHYQRWSDTSRDPVYYIETLVCV